MLKDLSVGQIYVYASYAIVGFSLLIFMWQVHRNSVQAKRSLLNEGYNTGETKSWSDPR